MSTTEDRNPPRQWRFDEVSAGGERITHLHPNDCYYAHLSIYHFAVPWGQGKVILDAGSGAGYGSAFLAEQGAAFVHALELSEDAVAFSKDSFERPNLRYQVMNLERIEGFDDQSIDLIFTSNVLEHVPNVLNFLRAAWRLLKPDGTMIIAVPPITCEELRLANLENPYHLNLWSPRQWHSALGHFFDELQGYRHVFDQPGIVLDFANSPEQTRVTERDFTFEPVTIDQAFTLPTLTTLFVARRPRIQPTLGLDVRTVPLVDDSLTIPADSPFAPILSRHLAERGQTIRRLDAKLTEQTLMITRLEAELVALRESLPPGWMEFRAAAGKAARVFARTRRKVTQWRRSPAPHQPRR